MNQKRTWCHAGGLFTLSLALLTGCAAEVASPDENASTDEDVAVVQGALTTYLDVDFESAALGPLGAPWSISSAGGSTASIVGGWGAHGNVLKLHGSTALGAFLVASLGFSSSSAELTTSVDIRPDAGASFIWALNGAGSSIGARRIRLQRAPGSSTLVAQTSPSGTMACGALPSNTWSRVTLLVHTALFPHTFDVRINGAATSCTGIATGLSAPFNSVTVMDASNEGWGGDVRFDNILVTSP